MPLDAQVSAFSSHASEQFRAFKFTFWRKVGLAFGFVWPIDDERSQMPKGSHYLICNKNSNNNNNNINDNDGNNNHNKNIKILIIIISKIMIMIK